MEGFKHPRVRAEPLARTAAGLEARLMSLIQASYMTRPPPRPCRSAARKHREEDRALHSSEAVARLGACPLIVRKESRYDLSDRLVSHSSAEQLFDRYQPALLVTSNPGLILAEVPLLRTAARRGVLSIAVDASWDNFTNKVLPVRRVNRLVVWNQLMKQQAVELHGYRPEEVRVTGTPHWDLYFRGDRGSTRDVFLRRIGADPSRKLVTLTTTALELYPH